MTVTNIITTVLSAWIDGEKMQDSNTKNLIFDIPVSAVYFSFQFRKSIQKYFGSFSKFVLSLSSTGSVKYAHWRLATLSWLEHRVVLGYIENHQNSWNQEKSAKLKLRVLARLSIQLQTKNKRHWLKCDSRNEVFPLALF